MTDPYSKTHTHIKPLIDELAVHLANLTANELKSIADKLRNYLIDDSQQLQEKMGDNAAQSTRLIKRLLDGYNWGSRRFKELGEKLDNVLQKEIKKRVKKIDLIIKKSCKVKKLTLCLRLENQLIYKKRLERAVIQNYANESIINDILKNQLLTSTIQQLETVAQYKPYPSTLFKKNDFEYYIKKTNYLSTMYYACISNSITKLEHLRVQLEINSTDIRQDYTTLEQDFKIHKKELKKVNTILAKLGDSKYAELKDYITKINPKLDKNTAADIVFNTDNYTVMKNIKSIEKRILTRVDRNKTDNARRKIRVFTFQPNQLSRRNFLSYDSSARHKLIGEFIALDEKITKQIIDSKKNLKYTKSEKKHEISIPKELNKKIKKLAGVNGVEEQLLINIIFQDDNDKYQELTERFTKPAEEKTPLLTSPPLANSAKEQLTKKHAEQTIKIAISKKQASLERSEQTKGASIDDKQPSQEEPCTDKDENLQTIPMNQNDETAIPTSPIQTSLSTNVAIENLTNILKSARSGAAIENSTSALKTETEKPHTSKS